MKKGENKMMDGKEKNVKTKAPDNEYLFPAQDGKPAETIKAASLEEANKIYHKD